MSGSTSGEVTFVLSTGARKGPFQGTLTLSTPKDGYYLDVTKKTSSEGYPSKLDIQGKFGTKVVSIEFKPGMGKATSYSTWTFFNHGAWATDRFTKLG